MDLSIVLPAYDEASFIGEALRRITAFLSHKDYESEILVSDDGSRDGTASAVKAFQAANTAHAVRLLNTPKNSGKGAAVRRAVLAAEGRYILVTDVDLSAPIKEVDKLIRALEEGYDVAIGSRAVREAGCDVQQSLKRRFAGRVFNVLVKMIVLRGIHDTQCGFKCFRREAARFLFEKQKVDGFSFDVEILLLARLHGFKIKEVPVMWKQALSSRIRLFRDSVGMVRELFRIRQMHGFAR